MTPLSKIARYRQFSDDKNRALQVILNKKMIEADNWLTHLKNDVLDISAQMILARNIRAVKTPAEFMMRIHPSVRMAAAHTIRTVLELRRITYSLSYVGELEAIARATNKPMTAKLTRDRSTAKMDQESPSGGSLGSRITMYFDRLGRKIVDAYQTSRVLEESPEESLERIASAFPRARSVYRPKSRLRAKPKEARTPTRRTFDSLVAGFIDDDLWAEVVDSYLADVVTVGRGPEDTVKVRVGKEKVERYTWEVEKEITEDFVQLVREGQIDAAKENGIRDFIWIAVVDDKTDACCLWRDGLAVSEISRQLEGKRRGDECQATVPPAHFNCRCDLAPMTDDVPERGREGLGDFETWLTKK